MGYPIAYYKIYNTFGASLTITKTQKNMKTYAVVYSFGIINLNNKRFDLAGWEADSCPSPSPIYSVGLNFSDNQVVTFDWLKSADKGIVRPNGKFVKTESYSERMFLNDIGLVGNHTSKQIIKANFPYDWKGNSYDEAYIKRQRVIYQAKGIHSFYVKRADGKFDIYATSQSI